MLAISSHGAINDQSAAKRLGNNSSLRNNNSSSWRILWRLCRAVKAFTDAWCCIKVSAVIQRGWGVKLRRVTVMLRRQTQTWHPTTQHVSVRWRRHSILVIFSWHPLQHTCLHCTPHDIAMVTTPTRHHVFHNKTKPDKYEIYHWALYTGHVGMTPEACSAVAMTTEASCCRGDQQASTHPCRERRRPWAPLDTCPRYPQVTAVSVWSGQWCRGIAATDWAETYTDVAHTHQITLNNSAIESFTYKKLSLYSFFPYDPN